MKKFFIKLLRFYKKNISKGLYTSCVFTPTCSEYAIEALEKRSFFVAIFLIIRRLLRCNPLSKGGFDPVPDSKNVVKWLI
ncbi:MAG: membrane protein insertion efficiency factor YidD [Clostridia bacterium]|nr:membrane protein insertion efficiency factor YidD [Clostridia bacterium]MBR7135976.1 membrane protein insertion efficiency factor YidD [Clostridia bacterium]